MDDSRQTWATARSLLERLRADDPAGWRRFVKIYTPLVYGWARKAGLQESDAADITQEVFSSVAANLGRFNYGRPGDSFRGWLWTITRNAIRASRRRQGREAAAEGGTDALGRMAQVADWVDEETVPDAPSAEAEVVRRAAELVRGDFEESTWQAFWRASVEGQASTEIAQQLGLSPGAVRQAKFRVLARLREYVEFV